MIGKCTKQLTNAVTVSRAADMAGGTVGGGDTQRCAGIGKVHKFRVFAEAREHTASRVRDDKLECAGASAVGDQPAVGALPLCSKTLSCSSPSAPIKPATKPLGSPTATAEFSACLAH